MRRSLGSEVRVTKKVWRKPEVKSIVAGSAENKRAGAADAGPGTHVNS